MMRFRQPRVIPVMLFPGDWCINCIDPHHPDQECYMLEMTPRPDGAIISKCGCTSSVTADSPGRYVVRVTQLQKE